MDEIPSATLWVGYPGDSLHEDDLRAVFAAFGMIESLRMLPHKNCMFVEYADKRDAWQCFTQAQQRPVVVRGSNIRIGWGRSRDQFTQNRESAPSAPSNSLWVGSLHPDVGEQELGDVFSRFGDIDSIRLLQGKNCAFVTYRSISEAQAAYAEMNGFELFGQMLKVNFAAMRELREDRDRRNQDDRGGGDFRGNQRNGPGVIRPVGGLGDYEEPRMAPVAEVPAPANEDLTSVIHELAKFVLQYGSVFEEKVRDLQKSNPRFEFLKSEGGTGTGKQRFGICVFLLL